MLTSLVGIAGVILGAILGVTGQRLATRDQRRRDGWNAWVELNEAVRGGDRQVFARAIGRAEHAWFLAGVPDQVFRCARTTARWYVDYFEVLPPGTVPAPVVVYDIHAEVVEHLRRSLKQRWWQSRRTRGRTVDDLERRINALEPEVEAAWAFAAGVVDQVLSGSDEARDDPESPTST